jgi:ornithine decarboxylase
MLQEVPVQQTSLERVRRFLQTHRPATPCLVIDLETVRQNYTRLRQDFSEATLHYRVKANADEAMLRCLAQYDLHFNIASPQELYACLMVDISPTRIVYSQPLKKEEAIVYAYQRGVRSFAFDSLAELRKLALHAPGSSVLCAVDPQGKAGCEVELVPELFEKAKTWNLQVLGLTYPETERWYEVFQSAARLHYTTPLGTLHLNSELLTQPLKHSFPAHKLPVFLSSLFGAQVPRLALSLEASLLADAALLQSEVVSIRSKTTAPASRWVYLDAEALTHVSDAIYSHRQGPTAPVTLSSSLDTSDTCEGLELPLSLEMGDKLEILSAARNVSNASLGTFYLEGDL